MNPLKFMAAKTLADDSLANHRRGICASCEKKRIEAVTGVELCDKCGCIIKAKTRLKHATCPLNKW